MTELVRRKKCIYRKSASGQTVIKTFPDTHFATCLIEDKNGNKGIALLSGKIVKQINESKISQ